MLEMLLNPNVPVLSEALAHRANAGVTSDLLLFGEIGAEEVKWVLLNFLRSDFLAPGKPRAVQLRKENAGRNSKKFHSRLC